MTYDKPHDVGVRELHTSLAKQHNFNIDMNILLYENSSGIKYLQKDLQMSMMQLNVLAVCEL